MISEPIACCIAIDDSGVSIRRLLSWKLRNRAPRSPIAISFASEKI